MDDCNIFDALGQASSSEAGSIFRNFLRGSVRHLISSVMAEEVAALCGPKHQPNDSKFVRAGSAPGRVLIDDKREDVVRPRVRQRTADGSQEVSLETYLAANDTAELLASIIQALASGVSNREMKNVKPGSPGVSRSNVSRYWQQAGDKFINEFRG